MDLAYNYLCPRRSVKREKSEVKIEDCVVNVELELSFEE